MPITKGAGNPDWTRDETILALDLLYRHGGPVDKRHGDVIELSRLLRGAAIHPIETRKGTFRNPDGVALKLQNLQSAIDPARGLSSSRTDREVVADFPLGRKSDIAKLALAISEAIKGDEYPQEQNDEDDDILFPEGEFATRTHRKREQRLRKKLLKKRSDNQLNCEMCNFCAPPLERGLRESFFEAHHIVPLAHGPKLRQTRISDLALLCANCHRFLHRLITKRKQWVGISDARHMLKSGK